MTGRARLQLDSWSAWVQDPSFDLSKRMNSLDSAEHARMATTLKSLNDLILRAGLDRSAFLEVDRQVTNLIRVEARGLPPLSPQEFSDRYARGMSGVRTRFYEDEEAPPPPVQPT